MRRTQNRDRKRPLLQNDDPEAVLRKLMAVRDPLYREIADHVIDTDGCSPRTVAQRLVATLRRAESASWPERDRPPSPAVSLSPPE